MSVYQPSKLILDAYRYIQMRLVPPLFELVLRDDQTRKTHRAMLSSSQIRQVTLDMRSFEMGNINLVYAARHILIEVDGKLWARVEDVAFMQLHSLAADGAGENVGGVEPNRVSRAEMR